MSISRNPHGAAMDNFLFFSEIFSPTRGGSAVWFDKVYSLLGDSRTHILTAKVPNDEQYDSGYPLTVHRLRLERKPYLKPESLPMYLRFLVHGLRLGVTNKFHSVHAGRVLPEGLVALVVARLIRRPCLVYAHGEEITTWTQPAKQRFLRFVYCHVDAVIANSRFTQQLLLDMGVSPARIHLIHPGFDDSLLKPGLETGPLRESFGLQGKKVILSVGRLSRRKGFDSVIRALPMVLKNEPQAHYALGGIGGDADYLKALVAEVGVDEHVTFLGELSDEDLPYWYNLCDVFIMPNRKVGEDTEGFGMVFIEANACGRPAIAGLAGGTGDAVIDGETGLRVDGESLNSISEGICRVLGDPQFAKMLGDNGLNRAREGFSWPVVARKTREVLADLG